MQSTNHPQDELLIVEALTQLGENLDGTRAVRAARARRLGRDIAASTWAMRCFRSRRRQPPDSASCESS